MSDEPTALTAPTAPTAPAMATCDVPPRQVKVTHLVVGLILLGIAGLWALDAAGMAPWTTSRYLAPGVLVGAGVIGLVVWLLSGRASD